MNKKLNYLVTRQDIAREEIRLDAYSVHLQHCNVERIKTQTTTDMILLLYNVGAPVYYHTPLFKGWIFTNEFNLIYLPAGVRCQLEPADTMTTFSFELNRNFLVSLLSVMPMLSGFIDTMEDGIPAMARKANYYAEDTLQNQIRTVFTELGKDDAQNLLCTMNIIRNILLNTLVVLATDQSPYPGINKDSYLKINAFLHTKSQKYIPIEGNPKWYYTLSPKCNNANAFVCNHTINKRMDKAKALLRDTNMPIREIARKVNYKSVSAFSRMFKKITSLAPAEFRRSG